LEVLKQKLTNDSAGADEIEVISRAIQRLDRVVKSFLDFTRPVELKVEEFDFGRLVAELAGLVRLDAEAQGIQVICDTADEVVVRGDRDLLKQALLNVVVNGLQASSSGGTLELRLEGTDDGWLVRIKDHGAGIPEDIRPQIFQLYFSTKGGKGSGIGLAMTFQAVQLHGGTIDVVSGVGQGTEFRILMPTARVIGATTNRRKHDSVTPPEFS
jgi:signal transduction histidine kinase